MQEGHVMAEAVCHHADQGSTPGQSVWGLWWIKWHGDRVSPASVMPQTLCIHSFILLCVRFSENSNSIQLNPTVSFINTVCLVFGQNM